MMRKLNYLLWLLTVSLLVTGMLLPMFSFQKFYIFDDTYSLIGGVLYLLEAEEFLLFVILLIFSVLLPLYKMLLLLLLISGRVSQEHRKTRWVNRLAIIGKWSMTDVFVIAVIAASVKLGMVATVTVHSGLYLFGVGVLLSMVMVHQILAGYELRPIR